MWQEFGTQKHTENTTGEKVGTLPLVISLPKGGAVAMLTSETSIDRVAYNATSAWGLSTAVCAYGCDRDAIRSREAIVAFTHELCDLLGVKRFGETQVVRFGDEPRTQ